MRRRESLPTFGELTALAREHGIDHLGVAPAGVLDRARRELVARREAGFHAGMAFTFRNPDRSTDPQRAVPGARSIIVAARSYLADGEPARPAGAHARVARYAWVDHYGPLRAGLQVIARRLRTAGERAIAFADDNSVVDREVAYLGGLGWFGKNANLLVAGAGSWFVLGSVVTTAAYDEHVPAEPVSDGCGSCRRCLDVCPTGAIVAPGVIDGARCLAWVLQRPGAIPVELRSAIGDRIYGCDDCQEACPPTVRLGRRHRRPLAPARACRHGSTCSTSLTPTTSHCCTGTGGGTSPAAILAGYAATLSSCSATSVTAVTLGRWRRWLATETAATRCSPSTPGGPASASGWRSQPPARRARRREAPVGDERLPAEDRRDPVAALGVVAALAARVVRRADQPVRGGGRVRRRAAVPCRAGARAGAAAAPADGAADQRTGRRDRCLPGRPRPGGAAGARRPVAALALRRCPPRSRGDRSRAHPRNPAGARRRASRGPPHRVGGGVRRPRGRACRRPGAAGDRGSAGRRRRAVPAAQRRRARCRPRPVRHPGRRRAGRVDLPARAPQGIRRGDPRGGSARPDPSAAVAGDRRQRTRRAAPAPAGR